MKPALLLIASAIATSAHAADFDAIQFWVGEGQNKAALVIDWDEAPGVGLTLAWGYRWDGVATGRDLLAAVVAADQRLFAKLNRSAPSADRLYGLGYDIDADGRFSLDSFELFDPAGFASGFAEDSATADGTDLWAEGWQDLGYWHYARRSGSDPWVSDGSGFALRTLASGDSDGWVYTSLLDAQGEPRPYVELDDAFPDTPTPAPPPRTPGDFNADGRIDAADYTAWRDAAGQAVPVAGAGADADLNSLIDNNDLAAWRSAYATQEPASAAVPEPATVWLLLAVSTTWIFSTRNRST